MITDILSTLSFIKVFFIIKKTEFSNFEESANSPLVQMRTLSSRFSNLFKVTQLISSGLSFCPDPGSLSHVHLPAFSIGLFWERVRDGLCEGTLKTIKDYSEVYKFIITIFTKCCWFWETQSPPPPPVFLLWNCHDLTTNGSLYSQPHESLPCGYHLARWGPSIVRELRFDKMWHMFWSEHEYSITDMYKSPHFPGHVNCTWERHFHCPC